MKKIISLVLSMALLLSVFGIQAVSADTPKIDTQAYDKITEVLSSIGVLEKDFDLNGEGYVTYNEFVGYLANLTDSTPAVICDRFGISEDILNEVATNDKVIEIVVNLLGWEYKAKQNGYASVASMLDLTDGVLNTDKFCRYDVLTIISNALTADYLEQTQFGASNKYTTKESTLLSAYKDIYEFSGVILANKWSTTYSAAGLGADKITVDEDEMGVVGFNYYGVKSMDLLGAYVSGYYKKDGAESEVLTFWSDGDELVLYSENYPEYNASDKTLSYTDDNDNNKKIAVPDDVTVVVNGRNYGDLSIINDKSFADFGTIRLYKVDGKYKTIHIDMYTNNVVRHTSNVGSVLGFVNNTSIDLDADEIDESIFIYDGNGKKINFKDIKKGNVVSVFKSINNASEAPVINVYAYDSQFTGKIISSGQESGENVIGISKFSTDDENNLVYDDEIKYKMAYGYDYNAEIGSCYNVYTDFYNRIVYTERSAANTGRLTGLYIKIDKDNSSIDSDYKIFMMPDLDSELQAGAQIIDISGKAKINYEKDGIRKEVSLKNADLNEVNTILMHTAMYYFVNSDGVVNKITGYSSRSEKGYLFNYNPKGTLLYTHTIATLKGKTFIECSKHYWTAANYYGGGDEAKAAIDKEDPNTFYGKNYIRYGDISDEIIVLPDIKSPDQVSTSYTDKYYKKAPIAQYGIIVKSAYLNYNAFSHDGNITPDYGTIACDTSKIVSTASRYSITSSKNSLLINHVSYVTNQNGSKVIKIDGWYKGALATVYTETDKIIDIANSETNNIQYIDELSQGDFLLVQCNANGEISKAIKLCDYDPDNDIVTLPKIPEYLRLFKDPITNTIINDTINNEGIKNIKSMSDKRCTYLGYAYKNARGISLVLDDVALLNAQLPKTDPEQDIFSFTSGYGSVMYYNTKLDKTETKRVGTATTSDAVSYIKDPSDMSRVFVLSTLGESSYFVIYK